MKLINAHKQVAYQQVQGEEGTYEAAIGWNVFAETEVNSCGYRGRYVYTGGSAGNLAAVYDEEYAQAIVDMVSAGLPLNEAMWHCYEVDDVKAAPDYVANPHRAEYN